MSVGAWHELRARSSRRGRELSDLSSSSQMLSDRYAQREQLGWYIAQHSQTGQGPQDLGQMLHTKVVKLRS